MAHGEEVEKGREGTSHRARNRGRQCKIGASACHRPGQPVGFHDPVGWVWMGIGTEVFIFCKFVF